MPTRFASGTTSADKFSLLAQAMILTDSEGFMPDAVAVGAWGPGNDTPEPDAIAVFQNATTQGAEGHFAVKEGAVLTREMMRGFLGYAFRRRRFPRLVAPIRAWNSRAQVAALKAGFFPAGYLAAGADARDNVIVYMLTEDACRWLPPRPAAHRNDQPEGGHHGDE